MLQSSQNAPKAKRIHVVGASGSGTSTFGQHLAARLACPVFDTDNFYWLPSDPPFQNKRTVSERLELLEPELSRFTDWVLSGSLASWGDPLVPRFTHVVFLTLAPAVRLERLRVREEDRYSAVRLNPGGDLHDDHVAFMQWAARYDVAGVEQRSLVAHEAWMAQLPTSVRILRLNSALPVDALVDRCLEMMSS